MYTTENWLFSFPSDNQIFTLHPVPAKPCKLWDGASNVADFSVKNVHIFLHCRKPVGCS